MSVTRPFTFRSDPAADPASVDTWVSLQLTTAEVNVLDSPFTAITSGPISVNWKNTGAEDIDIRILGSNSKLTATDEALTLPLLADIVQASDQIDAGKGSSYTLQDAFYQFYYFQHKAAIGSAQGASLLHGRHGRL